MHPFSILIIIIKHGSIYFHLSLANKFITHTVYIIQCIYHAKVKPQQIKNHSMICNIGRNHGRFSLHEFPLMAKQ